MIREPKLSGRYRRGVGRSEMNEVDEVSGEFFLEELGFEVDAVETSLLTVVVAGNIDE